MKNRSYIQDINRLIEETPVERVLQHYGLSLPEKSTGEHRMPCPFSDECRESHYGNLTINLSSPAKLIYSHCCFVRGNLLTLIHGLETGRPPSSDRLRGDEFKAAVQKLKEINGQSDSPTPPSTIKQVTPEPELTAVNISLKDQEKTAALVNLWEDCVVDVDAMSPAAAAYFRKRPWLTPEVCHKWKMGYLPRNGRSLLRGMVIYAHENMAGDVLSYSGRDGNFDQKWQKWLADGQPEKQKPNKHRYVKGYHRGQELYGQQAYRLEDRQLKESLGRTGLVIVEGQNDVIRLDCLGVAAVGLCSNQATAEQIDKITSIAKQASNSRVVLLPDNDPQGESGAKELLWQLASNGLTATLAWSRTSHEGRFDGHQPEDLSDDEWELVLLPCLRE